MAFSVVQSTPSIGFGALAASITLNFTQAVNANGASTVMGYAGYLSSTNALQAITVTDSASNNYNVANNLFNGNAFDGAGAISFYLIGVHGSPTSITFHAAGANTIAIAMVMKEVSGIQVFDKSAMNQQGAGGVGGPANSVDAATSGATPTLSTSGDFIYGGLVFTGSGTLGTMSAGTSFALNNNQFASGIGDEDRFPYNSKTGIAATFSPSGYTQLDTETGVMAFSPTLIIVTEGNYRRVGSGASFVFIPRTMHPLRDEAVVPISNLRVWEPFPQYARKHTAPTRAWARLDEQFMPTWNAVLIPKLQSWELPIQFARRLFQQSKSQPDVPSFVAAPVAQPYGFDFTTQGAARIIWQSKSQPETPSFIPQLSILDSIIQFTSRLLLRRPQVENPIVIPVVAAPRADLELVPRRLIMTEHAIPVDLVSPVVPVVSIDREQFPARLEFTPHIQQFESFVIVIATQLLQLTLAAWKWVAQAPSLAFTLTGSLVAWIWKAQAALLVQTMVVTLKAWIWKPFAALLTQTIVATHAVWKWLPQSAILLLSLGFSAPGVIWKWLAQAPSFFFPITLQTTTAVWLWVGRALAGGTHFAKVVYGLLLQVGRLRNR